MNSAYLPSKRIRTVLYICAAIAILGIGFSTGWIVGIDVTQKHYESKSNSREQNIIDVGSVGEASILPETNVEWLHIFSSCGHELSFENNVDYTGYTKADIEAEIKGATVVYLTKESARICIEIDEYCPEHYMLILTEPDLLCVFKTNADTLEVEQVMELNYDTESLDPTVINELESGILFNSLNEIDSYLENAET